MHLPGGSLGFPVGSYVGWWMSPIGGMFGGRLVWGVWWRLVYFGLVLEFLCLGTSIYGGCGIGCEGSLGASTLE